MSQVKRLTGIIKKHRMLIFILAPLVPLLVAFFIYYHKPFYLVKTGLSEAILYNVYADKGNKGNSSGLDITHNKGELNFTYVLRKGVPYPFAGVSIKPYKDGYSDFSVYDYIKVNIKASRGTRLPFMLTTYIENYTKPDDFNTLRNNQYILNVTKEFKDITIELKDLKTPDWWYTLTISQKMKLPGQIILK
jgi:hypothetical protein